VRRVIPRSLGDDVRIAFVGFSSDLDGTPTSGEMIVSGLLNRGWDVDAYFGFDGPYVERLKRCGCSVAVVPHSSWLRHSVWWRFVRSLWEERRRSIDFECEFKRTRPDIVYVNSLVSYAAARAAHRLGIPLVWHMRELFSDERGEMVCPSLFAKRLVSQTVSNLATRVVANSLAVGTNIFGEGSNVAVEIVPNAISEAFFQARGDRLVSRQPFNLPESGPIVGLPGTLRPVKGHHFLFKAIPSILERVPDCLFAVTGAIDSQFARDIVKQIQEGPLAGRVLFTGRINDMVPFYHACDVCCVPSLSESFGRAAIECFATRTPVVVTSVGGLKEIVRDGSNGLLVQYGDEMALADAIVSLLTDSQRANGLVEQAVLEAKERYTESVYFERIATVIDEALALSKSHSEKS
jgi:glycosyltransferase involved in cell wall biosynthesis